MSGESKKKQAHRCPPIPEGWTVKATGPAWYPGMTLSKARSAWAEWLRLLARVTPMPRRTS